jgi:hypothetical protein
MFHGAAADQTGMSDLKWACLAALAVVIALTGCGSAGSTTQTATRSSQTLTRAQYLARAEAVCQELERTRTRLSANKKPFPQKVREGIRVRKRTNEQLREIPSSSAEAFVAEWLHFREVALKATQTSLETKPGSEANDRAGQVEFNARRKASAIAEAAGLTSCAHAV